MSRSILKPPYRSARVAWCAVLFLAASVIGFGSTANAEPIALRTKPIVHFERSKHDVTRHDRLEFLGGLELSGPRGFGGLSGVVVEGERLTAVTDAGHWFTARLVLAGNRLAGLEDAALTRRMDVDGQAVQSKVQGDAEALTRHGDTLLVAVEAARLFLAYPFAGGIVPPGALPSILTLPAAIASEVDRGGLEALATLPNGDIVLFTEGRQTTTDIAGAIHPSGRGLTVRRHGTFAITGASALPGGDVILAERRYDGGLDVGLQIRRIGADAFTEEGEALDGPVLLRTDLRSEIDNIEAISAQVIDGDIILTLLSDDNFNIFQRTLVLRFSVADPIPRPKPPVPDAAPLPTD